MMRKSKILKHISIIMFAFALLLCANTSVVVASTGISTIKGTAKDKEDPTDTDSGSTAGLFVDGDDDDLDSTTDNAGANDISVQAKILTSGDYYSVTVEWGNMQFLFDRSGTWDPESHTYVATQTPGWDIEGYVDAINNKILVTNNSNKAVDVKAAYEHSLSGEGTFFNADKDVESAVRGYLFKDNASAQTCAAVLENSENYSNEGSVDNTWKTLKWYGESASGGATDEFRSDEAADCEMSYYFAFCGTPDETKVLEDWTKVGVVTVTVTPYDETHYLTP